MKTKKYIFLLLILLILINITSINAMENNTGELETKDETPIEIDGDILSTHDNHENNISQKNENMTRSDILSQNNNEDVLSDFIPLETKINIMVNDTSGLETSGNITINMHFSFTTIEHNGEFPTNNINIYENDTLIRTLNIGEQNLPELKISTGSLIYYDANLLFNYTLHENSYLTTSIFGIYSNTLHFNKMKTPLTTNLNDTQINIDCEYFSNETWNNSITSFKKALYHVKNNGIIYLNDINILQDLAETILVNKNITIVGNNATFTLQKNNTLLQITPNSEVTFINLTFIGNNPYIISNNGKLQVINCTFKDNSMGLIDNNGELEIKNTNFNDIIQFYQETCTNNKGLINNNGILTIVETAFNNNVNLLPYNIPTKTENLKAIINNNNQLIINNSNFTNINHRIIFNNGNLTLRNNRFENVISTSSNVIYAISSCTELNNNYIYNNFKIYVDNKNMDGGALYSTNETIIIDCSFKNIYGNNGGCIFNTGKLAIHHSLIDKTQSKLNGGAIYNNGIINLDNTIINDSEIPGDYGSVNDGGGIYNNGILNINNSQISKCNAKNGGGIYNANMITVINSSICECSGTGAGIYNTKSANITNAQIINNHASTQYNIRYESTYTYYDAIYSGVVYNAENAIMNLNKSLIKENNIYRGDNLNWKVYYGTIKNDGNMEITGCIFDYNKPNDWSTFWGGDGSINIYNTGKLTVMYSYLFNTQTYAGNLHNPVSFLYNTGSGTCNVNYNFFCLNPNSIIRNANPNNYFKASFDDDYYPIKYNESRNITLYLNLTDGSKIIDFNEWDKLPGGGLKTTITLNINETNTINTTLKNNVTFLFTNTNLKGEYDLHADIGGHIIYSLVDLGKEYANMTVNYNNITYNDGNNVTFKINVTGNNTPLTGNITLELNNQKYTLTLVNGSCNFTAPTDLKPNTYTVKITYEGNDDYFKIKNQYYSFTIHKIPINITLDAPEIKIGQTGKLTIKISPSTSKMEGLLYVNGKVKTRADTTSIRTIDLKNYGVGIYNLTVIFDEDEDHLGGKASILFIVSKYKTNLTLESKDINAGENATINVTITPGDVRGDIILEINGVNRSGYLSAATTTITIPNLQNGTYHVTVYYPGDAKYLPSNASTTFNVARKSTQLNVTITNNPDLTGNIIVKTNNTNCTGPVGVYINNDPRLTLNLTQGMANFTVKFKRGTNLIYIYYLGDNYYSFATWNTTIPIEGKAIITTNQTTITEQNTSNYIIQLKDTDDNPYEYTPITVEFKNQNSTLTTNENGIAYYPVTCKAGTYNITITYKNYTKQDTITVKPSTINIDIKDILAGQTEIITITLPNNATGNITFTLDNTPYNKTLTNASTVLEVPNLSLGLHNLTITYSGDENFINQTITQTFHIKNSISWITLQSTNTVYGETITVKATVIAGATGNVTFQIANQTQTVTLTGNTAEATFKNITAGDKIITAHYNGDNIYQGSDNSIKISIARANTTLEIITSELKVNENILITAILNPDATGNVTFRIQGQYSPRNRTITDGNSSWLISPLNSGSYKLIVIYNGDNNYNSITHEEILIINRIEAKLTIKIGDVSDGDDLMVYATLTDINNRKVTDNITLEINGKYYKIIITNGAGSRNLGEFKAGKYTYSATYNGNNILAMAIADGEFNVVKSNYKITGNTDITQYYGATKYYKIRLTNNNQPVKNEIITITINKNTVKIKTDNNGYATLKLSLKAGKYTITATYKNVKVSNKITVKPTLITKNKKIKKGKTLTYTAKLLNKNGKALKNKKITFKINGKKYKAKTNKKGIAKIKVKNLKVGKYKILTTYGKQKNTNTITVKK